MTDDDEQKITLLPKTWPRMPMANPVMAPTAFTAKERIFRGDMVCLDDDDRAFRVTWGILRDSPEDVVGAAMNNAEKGGVVTVLGNNEYVLKVEKGQPRMDTNGHE